MRQLSDQEILSRAATLKKRHRSEWCRLVYEASVGRSMQQVATLLEYSTDWVSQHLKRYAVESAAGGAEAPRPLGESEDGRRTSAQIDHLVKSYAPKEPDEDYVAEYETQGHTREVAKCLAKAYEAGENAIDAGVLQESVSKENERVSKIVLPDGPDWEMRLRRACSDVKSAAGLLDRAKMNDLKRTATRKQIAVAHAEWMEQIERLQNIHPTFDEEVANATGSPVA